MIRFEKSWSRATYDRTILKKWEDGVISSKMAMESLEANNKKVNLKFKSEIQFEIYVRGLGYIRRVKNNGKTEEIDQYTSGI